MGKEENGLSNNEQEQKIKSGFVAIVGKPNVGKSTLLNSILTVKLSIVSPKPQTTRKNVLGIYSDSNSQIVFIDTPGLIRPKYLMQEVMMSSVKNVSESADLLLYISEYEELLENFPNKHLKDFFEKISLNKILVINKTDLITDKKLFLPIIEKISETKIFKEIILISALHQHNLDDLLNSLKNELPVGDYYYEPEILSTMPERFFVSELIRETIFEIFEQELPYSTEVQISEFKERVNGKYYIAADIIIERPTQKAIVIGKKGVKIKEIGEKSRKKIEEHLQNDIFLELFVKVRPKWRQSRSMLKGYGYYN